MLRKIAVFTMLYDEPPVRFQQVALEDNLRQALHSLKVVGRVGEDNVHRLTQPFHVLERVGLDGGDVQVLQLRGGLLDEVHAPLIGIDGGDRDSPARGELQTHIACAGKEVDDGDGIEEKVVVEDVEQALLAQVGGGPDGERGRSYDFPAFVFASNNAHSY